MGIWGGYDKRGRMPITPYKTFMLKAVATRLTPPRVLEACFSQKYPGLVLYH